ncbi:DUF3325 family protein [Alloalcanivorax sp. C16-2]|uniref:DUF3325 family protein n=1 Tax=Alloalcanivorax TaxID=3020832 RepID=UPI001931F087|nr:DUF3325 family protein [Alloalcanivorax marinus]MBL7250816.1 DUF3325 family protein [Alloalcanivorax marinus]
MPEALLLSLAALLCLIGMGWLALALNVHWKQVRGAASRGVFTARRLRAMAALALLSALLLCLKVDHATMASLVWVMVLAAAALAVALMLAWRPRWLAVLLARAPHR